ncbi:MAG: hypothetical protein HY645_01890 [Acidobacteria bacterium]|nr:hypothetical protein [Acidobacteriota bacterium]
MARVPRLKLSEQATWYHLISRVAGHRRWYPLQEAGARQVFFQLLRRYLSAYFIDVAAYTLMGNHYHLVVQCRALRKLSRTELRHRASLLYRNPAEWPQSDRQWKRFNKRLFDVSEFMRNLNQALARWYNESHERRGCLFGERFKSVILADLPAVLSCILYVDLNALRAGLVDKPEEWKWGSIHERERPGGVLALVPLEQILVGSQDALGEYRFRLYWSGAVEMAESGGVISERARHAERAQGFQGGEYLQPQPVLSNGLLIGKFKEVLAWARRLTRQRIYRRCREPVALCGFFFALRAPRSRKLDPMPFAAGAT